MPPDVSVHETDASRHPLTGDSVTETIFCEPNEATFESTNVSAGSVVLYKTKLDTPRFVAAY